MITLKKKEAFARALKAFGPWNTWGRAQHLAYGLIRGVAYARMERCSNDNPHAFGLVRALLKLGAWPELLDDSGKPNCVFPPSMQAKEAFALVVWVRKPIRVRREKPEAA